MHATKWTQKLQAHQAPFGPMVGVSGVQWGHRSGYRLESTCGGEPLRVPEALRTCPQVASVLGRKACIIPNGNRDCCGTRAPTGHIVGVGGGRGGGVWGTDQGPQAGGLLGIIQVLGVLGVLGSASRSHCFVLTG